jgi:hypothetical protein
MSEMAATQGNCSPVDTVGAYYALHQRDDAAGSLPPLQSIEMPEFYKLIGEPHPESAQGAARREARMKRIGNQQPRQADKPFQELGAFLHVLESFLKDLDQTGNSVIC